MHCNYSVLVYRRPTSDIQGRWPRRWFMNMAYTRRGAANLRSILTGPWHAHFVYGFNRHGSTDEILLELRALLKTGASV
jgi:hypothetical protein